MIGYLRARTVTLTIASPKDVRELTMVLNV